MSLYVFFLLIHAIILVKLPGWPQLVEPVTRRSIGTNVGMFLKILKIVEELPGNPILATELQNG